MSIESIKDRLLRFMTMENMSSTQLADSLGVQRSTVSHLLSGRNNPSYDFIVRILNYYKYLSADWLLCGVGEMYRQQDALMGNLFSQPAAASVPAAPAPSDCPSGDAPAGALQEPDPRPAGTTDSASLPLQAPPATSSSRPAPAAMETQAAGSTVPPLVSSVEKQLGRAIERIVIFYNDKSMEIYDNTL